MISASPFQRTRAVRRETLPSWLREIPAPILADTDALHIWLYALGLPSPSPVDVAQEREYRAYLAATACTVYLRPGA